MNCFGRLALIAEVLVLRSRSRTRGGRALQDERNSFSFGILGARMYSSKAAITKVSRRSLLAVPALILPSRNLMLLQASPLQQVTDRWAALDGGTNAPTGMPPFPRLLSSYAARPPWQVPGVDYRVGINTGVTLQPASSLPTSGSPSRSATGSQIYLSNNGSILDGYDLSGYQLQLSAANCIVQNCKFQIISAGGTAMTNITGSNWIIRNCEFYGNYFIDGWTGAQIQANAQGAFIYNYLERAGADFMDFYGTGSPIIPLIVKYNVVYSSASGGHPDWLALGGPTSNYYAMNIDYNLLYNIALRSEIGGLWGAANKMPSAGTQGIGPDGWSNSPGSVSTVYGPFSVSNNVCIAARGASINYLIGDPLGYGLDPHGGSVIGAGFTLGINNNYIDPSGTAKFVPKGQNGQYGPGTTLSGNINMLTGGSIS
jgi:hypothetical protein